MPPHTSDRPHPTPYRPLPQSGDTPGHRPQSSPTTTVGVSPPRPSLKPEFFFSNPINNLQKILPYNETLVTDNRRSMTSQLKIETCRRNGALSKGPKTPEGRAISARNSIQHGLLSTSIVLEGEDATSFTQLLETLTSEFNPQTEIECHLVETLAVTRWRQLRIWALEKATIENEQQNHSHPDPAKRTAKAFEALSNNTRTLDVLTRYETRFDRQYHRVLKHLISKRTEIPCTP